MPTKIEELPLAKRLALTRAMALLASRKERQAASGLLYYKPHKKQDWFHRCEATFRYWRTGNRFGKSDMGAAEDCAFAIGARIWLEESDPGYRAGIPQRDTKGVILCQDWPKARDIFTAQGTGQVQGKLFKFLPKDRIEKVLTVGGNVVCIKVRNLFGGISLIYIDTVAAFRLANAKAESSQWDWIHVDEPIPHAMWKGFSRGLMDTNGRAWFTCTPIAEPWIDDWFLSVKQRRKPLPSDEIVFNGEKAVCGGSSFDNPFTSKAGITKFLAGLDETTANARIEGIPLNMSGRIYNVPDELFFESAPPGWEDMFTPPASHTIYVAIDTHPSTEMAALFVAICPKGFIWVYDEIFMHLKYQELANEVLKRLENRTVGAKLIEPAAFIEFQAYGTSLATDLDACGLVCEKAQKDPRRGIILTKQAISNKSIFFSSALPRLSFELNSYVWSQSKPNSPRDQDDHIMECLNRLLLHQPFWVDPKQYDVHVHHQVYL